MRLDDLIVHDDEDEPYNASQKFSNLRSHPGMNGIQVKTFDPSHPLPGAERLQETEGVIVEVWPMAFNWRLVCFAPAEEGRTVAHGYCYFGRGPESRARAVEAGRAWQDPLHTHPAGFDKQAF